ncbi:MAG: PEP-CTERM sorting domain-containing protein [Planctomycetota bacterium]|nr:MAG: PEP-CTERM sorting domain-containing protein [Planctomycetota bacterium]
MNKSEMTGFATKFRVLSLLFAVALFAHNAGATPVPLGWSSHDSHTATFTIGSGSATVASDVYYGYASGPYQDKYVYAYQINNVNSGLGLSHFSVSIVIADGASAYDPDYEELAGAINPALWTTIHNPVQSVDAIFTDTIENGDISAILWFVSDYASGYSTSALQCMSGGVSHYATADVLSPAVPEPATVALLGLGALVVFRRKRLHA